jgi:hypothetical protein
VVAAAVVTTSGLHRIGLMAVATFSGRTLKGFESRAEALEWLAEQKGTATNAA